MTFELMPHLILWIVAFAVAAAAGLALLAGVTIDFLVRNRRIRTARHESIRSYYGHIALTH
ncbi:hypothetical protein [Nocardioides sp.]|uniref:hypothetical protein n=1 Tax=Nocardioides sp. TaxID=35761 RepID=UPI003D13B605